MVARRSILQTDPKRDQKDAQGAAVGTLVSIGTTRLVGRENPLRMMLVKRRSVARGTRVGLAHIGAFSRMPVKIASMRAGLIKVIDM